MTREETFIYGLAKIYKNGKAIRDYGDISIQETIKRLKETRTTIQPFGYVNEAIDKAIEELEKVDKYKWHDLRKNPDDLPSEGGKYLVAIDDGENIFFDILRFWRGEFAKVTIYSILAWKYIEPIEEVEE